MASTFIIFLVSALLVTRISQAFLFATPSWDSSSSKVRGIGFDVALFSAIQSSTTDELKRYRKTSSAWFTERIQDTLDYDDIVQRLFLRQIVTETEAMAVEALQLSTRFAQQLSNANTYCSADPFGQTAASISACSATRDEGGTIGWVERHDQLVPASILSESVISDLYRLQPKAGDVHILADDRNRKWHVIQVAEIWMNKNLFLQSSSTRLVNTGEQPMVGSFVGTNMVLSRRSLKGHGFLPAFPELKSYHIQTAGCQMNVADSERLAGILQNDLRLTLSDSPANADLIIFNTCSIRDHAEQKLYDALGPYAANKRKGKRQALIVTGCVAQQEGEALLKRVPEIDAVLGPQYVPHLQNVLEQVLSGGQQLVATAPMLLQEQNDSNGWHGKPVRGHDVRAWVNVIHGCNEHCTYCVVPATRGMEQSRTMEAILQECLDLSAEGYKEVTLLGQNIDAYGRDMVPKRTFAKLLEYLNANLPEKMRIRYVSLCPIIAWIA